MNHYGFTGLGPVKVKKATLLDILKKNRDGHRSVFEKALVKFREQALARLDSMIVALKDGAVPDLMLRLPIPEEHTEDYDRTIHMLELHTDDEIELSEEAYEKLVNDEWGWAAAFASNTSSYLAR